LRVISSATFLKHAGWRCCVCGKYGAQVPFSEPVTALKLFAKDRGLTLRFPESDAIHDKCLRKLKTLTAWKRGAAC
jgi:hypothetical protein